jgi:magnesium-protoporphyrin O-methyltransferase
VFSERGAQRALRRYRRRGLDRLSSRIARLLRDQGVDGSVLEAGGGIGALGIELLEAGAVRATNVELSPAYEGAAAELAREHGVEDRVERKLGDFVTEDEVGVADAVVMNRVVCCYPNYEALVGTAADRARRVLVFTFPRENVLVRAAFGIMNLWLRVTGTDFRGFVHPVNAMLGVAEERGLRPIAYHRGLFWQLAALERSA